MNKVQNLKIIEEFISNLPDKDFSSFCDRLLHRIFPEAIQSCSISDNGYTNICNNFYIVVPNDYEESVCIESLLPEDLSEFSPSTLTFLSNDSLIILPEQKEKIREQIGQVRIEIWGLETLKLKLSTFDKNDLYFIVDNDSIFSQYLSSGDDQQDEIDIIQSIFNYVIKNSKPIKKLPDTKSKEFKGIVKKIKLNFSNYQSRVFDMYALTYYHKTLVEKYIQEIRKHDKTEVIALKEFFRSTYCEITNYPKSTYPVNEFKFLEQLSDACLDSKCIHNKKYQLFAKAVVMYFFEYCDFGARNKNDIFIPKDPELFEDYNSDLT